MAMWMEGGRGRRGRMQAIGAAIALTLAALLAGCGGGSSAAVTPPVQANPTPPPPPPPPPPPTGTGTLAVSLVDSDDRPLAGGYVTVWADSGRAIVANATTDATGTTTFARVPADVSVTVAHPWSTYFESGTLAVAQSGTTSLRAVLEPARAPVFALLPVQIPPDGISADRSELAFDVEVLASTATGFSPSGYGDYSAGPPTPLVALRVLPRDVNGNVDCLVWLDSKRTTPNCGTDVRTSPYRVSVDRYEHVRSGARPLPSGALPAQSVLLLLDQSDRMRARDPQSRRSFAARRFAERMTGSVPAAQLGVAGFSGTRSSPVATSLLAAQPIWSPLGPGTPYSSDRSALRSAIDTLEPLVGGSAPVVDAMSAAIEGAATAGAPSPNAIIALLGGADDHVGDAATLEAAVAALARARALAGTQMLIVNGGDTDEARSAIADLAARLGAPTVSLDVFEPWVAGPFASLDLVADVLQDRSVSKLSVRFRLKGAGPDAFRSGTALRGTVEVEAGACSWDCILIPLEFTVAIP